MKRTADPNNTRLLISIEEMEGVDGHLAVTHSDIYVIGDAHTNTCDND